MPEWRPRRGWRDDAMEHQGARQPPRFWLRVGESRAICVLEDEPTNVWEHNVEIEGRFGNVFTCPLMEQALGADGRPRGCPLCARGDRPARVGLLSVVDLTEVTSQRTGRTYRCLKRVLAVKARSWALYAKQAEKRGGLRGCVFEVFRATDRDARVGTPDFDRKVDPLDEFGIDHWLGWLQELRPPKTPAQYLAPYEFATVCAPVTEAELARAAAIATRIGERRAVAAPAARDDTGGGNGELGEPPGGDAPFPGDEDIPF